jgi:hypothetical protein
MVKNMNIQRRVLRRSFGSLSLGAAFLALTVAGCNAVFGIDEHELLGADASTAPSEASAEADLAETTTPEGDDHVVPDTGTDETQPDGDGACTGDCTPVPDGSTDGASTDGSSVDASDGAAKDAAVPDAALEAGPACSANTGKSCGSCGGVYACNGACSIATPSNFGKACGSCGGVYGCNGACTVATPANYAQSCGKCGGVYACNGSCSVATPATYGQSCAGGCSYINCNGVCNAPGGGPTYGGSCPTSSGTAIVVGTTFGNYDVQSITLSGAPPGVYTFTIVSGDAGTVTLLRDGATVSTLSYNWQATVSGANVSPIESYTFDFTGYFSINVRGGSQIPNGTLNLYDLNADSLFDGAHYISVCCN